MKTQMKFQRRLCLCLIILGAAIIVYACLWKTGMLAAMGTLCDLENSKNVDQPLHFTDVSGATLFYETEPFNKALLWLGIASLLAACLLYVFGNQKKRNYYTGNYVMSIFVAVVHFGTAVVTMVFNGIYLSDLSALKADDAFLSAWSQHADDYATVTYSTKTGMFVFGYIVCALVIVGAVALILNMIWKRKLMQGERELLKNSSFAEEVA